MTTSDFDEAEQAVLGSILMDPPAMHEVAPLLVPEDFWLLQHRRIFAGMLRVHTSGRPVDVVTLSHDLHDAGELDAIGGVAYLSALGQLIYPNHAIYYAGIIRKASADRIWVEAAQAVARGEVPLEDAPVFFAERMELFRSKAEVVHWEPKGVLLDRIIERANQPMRPEDIGIPTGIVTLDTLIGGFRPGNFVIIGARPSVGKTSVATSIAHHVSIAGGYRVPSLFFSLEMLREDIFNKLICIDAGITWRDLQTKNLSPMQHVRLVESVQRIKDAGIDVAADDVTWTVSALTAAAESIHRRQRLGLIIVDYLQIVTAPDRENRTQEVSAISRSLKDLAKRLRIPVIALSQLNRASEHRANTEPTLADLRESGSIEQDADIVILLHSPHRLESEGEPPPTLDVTAIVAKNRVGPTGRASLRLRTQYMHFVSPARVDMRAEEVF